MTDQEQKEVRAYCAHLLKNHGIDISPNDPIVPALFIIHKEMQQSTRSNQAIAALLRDQYIKSKGKSFHFHVAGEASKFQNAVTIRYALVTGTMLIGLLIGFVWWSNQNDVARAEIVLDAAQPIGRELTKLINKDDEGFYYLELKRPTDGRIQNYTEFNQLNDSTIRVYFGRKTN